MTKKETHPKQVTDLRRQAEEIARGKAAQSPENLELLSFEETRQTLHELRVHQIELEIQNEELRLMHKELESARTRYFDLYDMAPAGYVTISEKGLILEANLTIATLLGVRRVDLVGLPFSRFIVKEDQEVYYPRRKLLFDTGAPQVCEMRMVKKDGTAFWAHMEANAASDDDDAPVCRIVIVDITERRRAEDTLTEALTRLKFLADAQRDYLHAISHELRTPMSGVLGIAELALEELCEEQRIKYMVIFESSRNRLIMAVDSALLLAELQGEGATLPTVPVDLVAIVTCSSCSLQEAFLAKDLSVVVPQTQSVLVLGNEDLLRQSTETLLKTALKMATVGTPISAQFDEDHDRAILRLVFQGQPLPDTLKRTFFDTFSYARSSSCVQELGLAIPLAAHVIRAMGGNVDLRETSTGMEILMALLKSCDQKET